MTRASARLALVTGGAGFIGSHLVDAAARGGLARCACSTTSRAGARQNLAERSARRSS